MVGTSYKLAPAGAQLIEQVNEVKQNLQAHTPSEP